MPTIDCGTQRRVLLPRRDKRLVWQVKGEHRGSGEVGEGKSRPRGWCWSCQKGSFPISTLGSQSWAVIRKEQCTETEEALGTKCLLKSWGVTHRSFKILFIIGVWAHVEVKGHPCEVGSSFFFLSSYELWGSNSGCQTGLQAPLFTGPCHKPDALLCWQNMCVGCMCSVRA